MYRMFAISVVFPTGLKLTAGQTARLNQWVLTRGLGVWTCFCPHHNTHRCCSQWTGNWQQFLLSVLSIFSSYFFFLSPEDFHDLILLPTADPKGDFLCSQCIRCGKCVSHIWIWFGMTMKHHITLAKMNKGYASGLGWLEFATLHQIGQGSVVLILFRKDNDDRLFVFLDVL